MSLTMYSASAPQFLRVLKNLSTIITKASTHAEEHKIDAAALLHARLYPNMFPFTRQIQIACDNAKGATARLAGIELPKHEDVEQTFAELQQRIDRVIAFIESVPADKFAGSDSRKIVLPLRGTEVTFTGEQYLVSFALPNFYFHVTTAYDILRHNGVELGKRDYIGNF
jgi:hypothetical protein